MVLLRVLRILLVGRHFAATLVLLLAALQAPVQAADIRDTKHNLVGRDDEDGKVKVAAQEVCVFCHTPTLTERVQQHGPQIAGAVQTLSAPRWQASATSEREFTLFDDIGRMGLEGVAVIGSVSVACLSCHDSSQAFGVGADASIDHPFGVPYRGIELSEDSRQRLLAEAEEQGVSLRAAQRLVTSREFRDVRKGVVNNRVVWWASSDINRGSRSKKDLPLYPRKSGAADDEMVVPFVECTSCHDPHSTNQVFLRVANSGARLCLTCHTK